ncbi:MAG: hypothetical protein ACK41E_07790 [Deinococcales bacterium]
MKKILITNLGSSHKTVVNAVLQHSPHELWIVCTSQSEAKIGLVVEDVQAKGLTMPTLNKTIVLHNDLEDFYQKLHKLLAQLSADAIITFDITGGTVPMSLGAWEATRSFPNVVVTWTDNTEPPQTHVLSHRR